MFVVVNALIPELLFEHPHHGQWRIGKHHTGNPSVIHLHPVPLQDILCGNACLQGRRGGEGQQGSRHISCRIDRRVGSALHVGIHGDPLVRSFHACGLQVQVLDGWHPPGPMDYQVGGECLDSLVSRSNLQQVFLSLHGTKRRVEEHPDVHFTGGLHQHFDEFGIEALQDPFTPVEDGDLRTCSRSHMCKFERYIPASYEDRAPGEVAQLQELIAGDDVILSRNIQSAGNRAGSDEDVLSRQSPAVDLQGLIPGETGGALENFDACAGQALFYPFGIRVR